MFSKEPIRQMNGTLEMDAEKACIRHFLKMEVVCELT